MTTLVDVGSAGNDISQLTNRFFNTVPWYIRWQPTGPDTLVAVIESSGFVVGFET